MGEAKAATERRPTQAVVLWVVYLNVVLYALCYQLQSPVEPFLVGKLVAGDDSRAYSRVQAAFSAIQMVGSFLVGHILDRFGLRGAFVINFIAAALSYSILANATSLALLYASKLPTVAMHGFLCAQATVSQCTGGGHDRVAALGRLTAAYTVGATLGPALGGYLGANVDHYAGAKLAVLGSLLSALLSYLYIPARLHTDADRKAQQQRSSNSETDGGFPGRASRVISLTYDVLGIKLVTGIANR
jgi:OCT family organic cation transporter-like MFS transporter 18